MLCYKDMTFCGFFDECEDGKDCHRALTEEIQTDAAQFILQVCQFTDKPECFEAKG